MSKTMAGLMIVIALIVGGVGGAMTSRPVFTVAAAGPDVRTGLQESFAPIVTTVTPSVVNISSSKVVKADNSQVSPFFEDPFFRRFFGDDLFQRQVPRERREHSLGSGVVVSNDGFILTNSHVVEGASDVKVSMSDRREFPASLVGVDPKTDLAVIRISQKDLQPIALGDSSKVQVGDLALAIGNPFGIGRTVTMGVVSATGRGGLGIEEYEDFIQTDAAINPGNSGGALINVSGHLIGINTAILSGSGGNQGIGFAVPVNMARYVLEQIVQTGKVSRAYLGVSIQPVTPEIATAFRLPNAEGALIGEVAPGSPAERAGIKPGDVILRMDGKPIQDSRALQLSIGQMQPGRAVQLALMRDGRERELSVTLGEQPKEPSRAESSRDSKSSASPLLDGIDVAVLTPEIARQLGLSTGTQGIAVTGVDPGSVAQEAGLERGDVILEVNRRPVLSIEQFEQLVEAANNQPIILFVNRAGRTTYMVVPAR
jgi:serine protease Do